MSGTTTRLAAVNVVLFEPQDPINIAAAIRAMKNMGVAALRLVRPVAYDPYRLIGVAHDTQDIINAIQHYETLDEALADCVRVAGFTARRRAAKREVVTPAAAATDLIEFAETGPVAVLFGREDKGLPNDGLDLAPPRHAIDPPTGEQLELLFADAARSLEAIAFFKTRSSEHVMRSLRSIVFRAAVDSREVNLLRAMAIEVMRTIERVKAGKSPAEPVN